MSRAKPGSGPITRFPKGSGMFSTDDIVRGYMASSPDEYIGLSNIEQQEQAKKKKRQQAPQ